MRDPRPWQLLGVKGARERLVVRSAPALGWYLKLEQLLERPGCAPAMQPKPTVARSAEQKQLREHEAKRRRLSGLLVGRAKSIGADKLCRVASVKPQLNQQNQKANRHH